MNEFSSCFRLLSENIFLFKVVFMEIRKMVLVFVSSRRTYFYLKAVIYNQRRLVEFSSPLGEHISI